MVERIGNWTTDESGVYLVFPAIVSRKTGVRVRKE